MATKKNTRRPAPAAPSAPDIAPATRTAQSAGPAPGGATAAIQGALVANPGATTAAIATAAGVSASAVGKALAALEAAGQATRSPGQRTGRIQAPATWHPVPGTAEAPAPAVPAEPARSAGEPDGPVGADGTDDGRPATAPASGETGNDENLAAEHDPGAAALPAGMQTEPETEGEPGGPAGTQDAPAASRAGDGRDSSPAGAPGGAADGHDDTGGAPGTGGGTGPGVPGAEAAAGMAELAAAAAQRAAQALAGGDITTALSELDAARDGTAQARRLARAATSRSARAGAGMRPGQLRDRVRDHLAGHPGTSLTPYEIARVLGNSAGAVSNALDRLVELGHAELASEHPRRYITTAATAAAS